MNEARRKSITNAVTKLEDAKNSLEEVKGEEEDYYENMPESLQNGEKGEKAQEAIQYLDDAVNSIESAIGELSNIE